MERQEFNFSQNNSQVLKFTGYQICIICDSSENKMELGTGFLFMRNDWIVTAAHVVQYEGEIRNHLFAKFPNPLNNFLKIQVIAVHYENDIALLQITSKENPCNQPLYPGYDDLSVSRGLICCGYTPSKGSVLTVSLANVYEKDYRHRKETETILEFTSSDIEGGSSGGPIFGDGGVVLGIIIENFSDIDTPDKKLARATSIKNLTKAINIDFDDRILIKTKSVN